MEDNESLDIDGTPLTDLRVVDLKKELDKRNLSKSGTKKQLLERLKSVRYSNIIPLKCLESLDLTCVRFQNEVTNEKKRFWVCSISYRSTTLDFVSLILGTFLKVFLSVEDAHFCFETIIFFWLDIRCVVQSHLLARRVSPQ